ncbi:hypothetical protein [Methylobacter sp.]|uniref:hypothetical protein n=1 Tax=Methylobacter sp. TaxID=2051955 RepID=UPI002FDCAF80
MRRQKLIPLDDNRSVIVKELHVRTARNMMEQVEKLAQVDIIDLFTKRFNEVLELLDDCVQMPPGESLDDLTGSELIEVKEALLEVNAGFLDLLGLVAAPVPQET